MRGLVPMAETSLEANSPFSRIQGQSSWTVQILPDQDLPMLPIQFGHLDAVGASISPVQVLPQPVHCHPLRIVQTKLHHVLQSAAVHEGPADGLQGKEGIKGQLVCFTSFSFGETVMLILTERLALKSETHFQSDVCPVDAVVCDIKVQRRGLLDARQRDSNVVVVGLQGDAADVCVAGEEQEGLGDDASAHVCDELQANGTATLNTLRLVEAEVAAAAIILCTWVCT